MYGCVCIYLSESTDQLPEMKYWASVDSHSAREWGGKGHPSLNIKLLKMLKSSLGFDPWLTNF